MDCRPEVDIQIGHSAERPIRGVREEAQHLDEYERDDSTVNDTACSEMERAEGYAPDPALRIGMIDRNRRYERLATSFEIPSLPRYPLLLRGCVGSERCGEGGKSISDTRDNILRGSCLGDSILQPPERVNHPREISSASRFT